MPKQFFIAMIVTMSLFVVSCSSNKHTVKGPPPAMKGVVLSKGIDQSGTLAIPTDQATEFYSDDDQVVAMLSLENISGSHKLKWEWIDPNGAVYLATENYPLSVDKGKYLPELTAWHQISIKDEPAADIRGEWRVDISIDNEHVESKSFVLIDDPVRLPKGTASKPYPNDWGLIIGIENYDNVPQSKFARRDAQMVRKYFKKVLGVPENQITYLIDRDANRGNIEAKIKDYLQGTVTSNSTLYVYYSGHGMPGIREGKNSGVPYLVPSNAHPDTIEHTGYRLDSFYNDLKDLKARHIYVFLDCCYSGGMVTEATGSDPALIVVKRLKKIPERIISFNSTSQGQVSRPFEEKRMGLFTYYLLRGMKGEADADDEGGISIKELYQYIQKHVQQKAARIPATQTPSILPQIDRFKDVQFCRRLS